MHKLTARDGYRYLTRQVAAGDIPLQPGDSLTAYYAASGNPPGRWTGKGLPGIGEGSTARLAAGAIVTEDAMGALFGRGHDPLTGEPLGREFPTATTAPNPDGSPKVSPAVVGYDFTFTVPKSVSVLWALGDDDTRAKVHGAHRDAVGQALKFVEEQVVRSRVGPAGARQIRTRGMLAVAFEHFDTRAGDPNLHTHVALANKTQGHDGQWRSLDGKTIFAATVTVSELYDVLLADGLARVLPVSWSLRERGARRNAAFEVDGIGEDLLAEFSTRSGQIHQAADQWATQFRVEHGRDPNRRETTKARQHFTLTTRPAKQVHRLTDLFSDWANRARARTGAEPLDLAARALAGTYGRALHAHDVGPEVRAAIAAQALSAVQEKKAVFTTFNLGAEALRASKLLRMASPVERRLLLKAILTDTRGLCVQLDDTRTPESRRVGEDLFTTPQMLGAERVLIDAAEMTGAPAHAADQVPAFARGYLDALAPDQLAAAQAVIMSGKVLDAMVGPAGSGKTTTLAGLAAYWGRWIGPVIGLAPSASAAHTLATSLGTQCETTAKWLYESAGGGAAKRGAMFDALEQIRCDPAPRTSAQRQESEVRQWAVRTIQDQWRFAPRQLVIIDEASMADTRTLADLTAQAQAVGAKVLLVGDHLQRGSVDAGGGFAMLARRGPTAELTSLWRFSHPWEARASLELRRAHPSALDTYDAHGAFTSGTADQMLDDALDAVTTARDQGRVAVLQAVDTRTVTELNARAHAAGVLDGAVSRAGVTLHDGLTAGVGDRIVTRRNNRHLPTADGYVRNGALWDVTAVLPGGALLARPATRTGHAPDGAAVRLPAEYVAQHVELGYATTTARSQGLTVDETHTIAAPGMGREDLYVAMSRGRDLNRTYVITDTHDDDCLPAVGGPAPTARDVLDQILATTHAELTATETWAVYHPDTPSPIPPRRRDYPGPDWHPHGLERRRRPQKPLSAEPTYPTRDGPAIGR
ncbi:MobF family relaxase [Pengzhenrongella phosphoraccumulans]|uniref:MobF family relaxase n=1 Tax=Pengzhenrongella phosphoraccumulans TaxID=3114394 RepID=UPI00388EB9FD